MKKFFDLRANGTNTRTEIIAGITTFATMAYILVIQSSWMTAAGMNGTGVMLATALISGLATLIMGLYAKMPFALAPGMGTNAILAFTLVAGGICTWQQGLTWVFISGCIFVLLSVFKIREKVVEWIPKVLKVGVGASVGAFLIRLSLVNGNMISVAGSSYALNLEFSDPAVLLAWIGLAITLILYFLRIHINGKTYHIRGSLLISIILITIIGIPMGVVSVPSSIITQNAFSSLGDVVFKLDFAGAFIPAMFVYILMFFMSDFFSTLGTALGVAGKAGMLDKDGNLPAIGRIFLVDSCATVVGAACGLTTVTTYVESASGVEAGGRTGMTAVVTAICFFLSMLFAPLFLMVPNAATAPALIIIGISMMQTLKDVDFKNVEWFPVGLMLIVSIFGGIANGIALGLVAYCLTHYARYLFTPSKAKCPNVLTLVITVLCCLQFIK
ncbi:MAG: NCS2 family permease [Clostridia bacterium]|nr:NCS2 family permease [Clostridia bacterium]